MALAARGDFKKKLTTELDYYQVFKKIIKDDKKNIYKIDTTWFNFPFSRNGWVSTKFIKFSEKKDLLAQNHFQNTIRILPLLFKKDLKKFI
jgi:hypothetical protein